MGITERVQDMAVSVRTPSGSVSARLHGRETVEVSFAEGFFGRTGEEEMQTELEQAARLLWAAHTAAYDRILDDEYEQPMRERRPIDRAGLEFHERRQALLATGTSPDGHVEITVRGMRDWRVRISPSALGLREPEFAAAVAAAAQALIADQQTQIGRLKVSVFDPGLFRRFGGQVHTV